MNRKITKSLALILVLAALLSLSAFAAPAETGSAALTPERITELQALPLTVPENAVAYSFAKTLFPADTLALLYGNRTGCDTFTGAHKHLMNLSRRGAYRFDKLGVTVSVADSGEFYRLVMQEAVKELTYASERLTVEFLTDESCLYQSDDMDCLSCTVRGVAKVHLLVKPTQLTASEISMLCSFGVEKVRQGMVIEAPVDVHMNTVSGYLVNQCAVIPLG